MTRREDRTSRFKSRRMTAGMSPEHAQRMSDMLQKFDAEIAALEKRHAAEIGIRDALIGELNETLGNRIDEGQQ